MGYSGQGHSHQCPSPVWWQCSRSWYHKHPQEHPCTAQQPCPAWEAGRSRALHQRQLQALTWQPRLPLSQAEIEEERGSAWWHCPPLAPRAISSAFEPGHSWGSANHG